LPPVIMIHLQLMSINFAKILRYKYDVFIFRV
jgi:hypothetical protein